MKNAIKITLLFNLLLPFCTLQLHAADMNNAASSQQQRSENNTGQTPFSEKEEIYKKSKIELLLPINHVKPEGERLNLLVTIPTDFKPVHTITHSLNTGYYEFIPRSDNNPNEWLEIIPVGTHVGKKVSASYVNQMAKQGIVQNASDVSIIQDDNNQRESYTLARLVILTRVRS